MFFKSILTISILVKLSYCALESAAYNASLQACENAKSNCYSNSNKAESLSCCISAVGGCNAFHTFLVPSAILNLNVSYTCQDAFPTTVMKNSMLACQSTANIKSASDCTSKSNSTLGTACCYSKAVSSFDKSIVEEKCFPSYSNLTDTINNNIMKSELASISYDCGSGLKVIGNPNASNGKFVFFSFALIMIFSLFLI